MAEAPREHDAVGQDGPPDGGQAHDHLGGIGALGSDEQILTTIAATLREGLLLLGTDLRVRAANDAFCRMFGLESEAVEGRPIYDVDEGRWDLPALRRLLEERLPADGACDDYELTYDADDRTRRVLLLNAQRIDDRDLVVLAIQDVTPRRAAEQEHEAYRERLLTALRHSPIVFAHVDRELRYEWMFNPHPDFDPAGIIGKRDDELDEGPGIDALMRLKRRVLERGAQERAQIAFGRSDGLHWYDVIATPVTDAQGRTRRIVTASLDVTDLKQAEEALRQHERLMTSVLDQMPSGISIAKAPSGRLLYHNDEAVRLLRHPLLPSEDFSDYAQYGALHDDDTPYAAEEYPIARALRGESVQQEQMRYRRGDGTLTTFMVNAAPVRDADGHIIRAVSTFEDISALNRVQERLAQLTETLEARVQERTEQVRELASELTLAEQRERRRISRVLHDDIQQLLYSLQLQARMVQQNVRDGQTQQAVAGLEDVNRALKRCADTTRQLTVDLSPLILNHEGLRDTLFWLRSQMEQRHGLTVNIEAPHAFRTPEQDLRVLLFRLVRELLLNVVEHAETDKARVELRDIDHHVEIVVEDEGRGFDVASAEQDTEEHAGFSLFSMRRRLRLFGGHLHIASTPQQGTRITASVPLRLE